MSMPFPSLVYLIPKLLLPIIFSPVDKFLYLYLCFGFWQRISQEWQWIFTSAPPKDALQELHCCCLCTVHTDHPAFFSNRFPAYHCWSRHSSGYGKRSQYKSLLTNYLLTKIWMFKPRFLKSGGSCPLAALKLLLNWKAMADYISAHLIHQLGLTGPFLLTNRCKDQLPVSNLTSVCGFPSSRHSCSSSCFHDAVIRKQPDQLSYDNSLQWMPRHLHDQLIRHKNPHFFQFASETSEHRLQLQGLSTDACSRSTLKGQDIPSHIIWDLSLSVTIIQPSF